MGKVSIGLRGWRFDEDEVFGDDGRIRPIGTMSEDTRARVLRLAERVGDPCDACWLIHGEADVAQCRPAEVVYGEPWGEVVLCLEHEPDFVYWFREVADDDLVGTRDLADAFHEWFLDGGRAPGEYAGVDHVERDPEDVPEAPDPHEAMPGFEEEVQRLDDEDLEALEVDLDDLDV